MKQRYVIILLLLAVTSAVSAQTFRGHLFTKSDTTSSFVHSYVDSLMKVKKRIDSTVAYSKSIYHLNQHNADYARLFVPMTFSESVVSDKFSIEQDNPRQSPINEAVDNALLHVYLTRPDLVIFTQSQLEKFGPVISNVEKPIKTKTDIINKVASDPVQPEIETFEVMVKKPNFWHFNGDFYLQFLQNYISENWYKGGESTYSMLGDITLQANYNNKQRLKWENRLEAKLGFQTSKSDTLHAFKTHTDQLRYTGKVGLQASRRWYYTFQLIGKTQFLKGYKNNDEKVYSDFISPLDLNASVGMDYSIDWLKHRLSGSIHFAPFAWNYRYVKRDELVTRYGIEQDKHRKNDFGSEINLDFNWRFSEMVSWKSRLYAFTSYKRTEVEWENTLFLKFNRYFSTNLYFYPRFDDSRNRHDKFGYFELKEYLSLGFTYNF